MQTIGDVARHRQMWKQRELLKDDADAATLWRKVDAARGVEQHDVIERDAARIGPAEPGDAPQDRALAGSRRAEQDGDACRHLDVDVETEGG